MNWLRPTHALGPQHLARWAPHSRTEAAAELARLEHERDRLSRDLATLEQRRKTAKLQLARLHNRAKLLHAVLGPRGNAPTNT